MGQPKYKSKERLEDHLSKIEYESGKIRFMVDFNNKVVQGVKVFDSYDEAAGFKKECLELIKKKNEENKAEALERLKNNAISKGSSYSKERYEKYCKGTKEHVSDHITKLKGGHDRKDEVFIVRYNSDVLKTLKRFNTEDEAVAYRDLCNAQIMKAHALKRTVENLTEENFEHREWPENIIKEIGINETLGNYWTEIVPNFDKNLLKVQDELNILSSRELKMIDLKYKDLSTLETIGNMYNLTRERVRQIIATAIRKLRHPRSKQILIEGIDSYAIVKQEEYTKIIDELKAKLTYDVAKSIVEAYEGPTKNIYKNALITELNMTVRSTNALQRAGITTVDEMVNLKMEDLLRIRNLGSKSVKEVYDLINKIKRDNGYGK